MSVTVQQNLQNLGSASGMAMRAIQHAYDNDPNDPLPVTLDLIAKSEWSQIDRLRFIKQLAANVLQYQSQFSPETVAFANVMLGQNFDGMMFDDFVSTAPGGGASLQKIFGDTLVDTALSAGSDVAAVGQGTLHLLRTLGGTASNVGDAAERLTNAAANPILSYGAVIGLVALVVLLAFNRTKRALT